MFVFKFISLIILFDVSVNTIKASPTRQAGDSFVFELPIHGDNQLAKQVGLLNNYGQGVRDRNVKSVNTFQSNENSSPQNNYNIGVKDSSGSGFKTSTIVNLPNPDAIVYPDKIAHDSYGNIVTPYTTLVDDPALNAVTPSVNQLKQSGIGHMTDVNRDGGFNDNDSGKIASKLGFVVPSYASGVTKVDTYKSGIVKPELNLQPPLSSGNYNYPQLNENIKPVVTQSPATPSLPFGGVVPAESLLPPAPGKYSNGFSSSLSSSSASLVSDGKFNNFGSPSGQSVPTTFGNYNSGTKNPATIPQATNSETGKYTGGFGGPTNQAALKPLNPQLLSSDSGKYTLGFGGPTGQSTLPQHSVPISSNDSGKYTGGFSSATNQAALKPQNSGSDSGKYTGSFGAQPGQPALTQQTIPVSSSDSGKYTGGFGSSTGQSNLPQQSGSHNSADAGKYTGGFGGATNQEALKPQNSGSDSGKYTGSFGAQPGQPALTQQTIPVSSSDSGKYTGGFGSSTGQSNLPQQSGSHNSADAGKYTGGFGGATNQEALKPQNSGSDSGKYTGSFGAQPGQPALTQQTIPVSSSDSGKYTGGFGSSTGQSNLPQQSGSLSSADSGKYTGGFGGATNQEALKPQNSGSDSGKYTGSFGAQPGQPGQSALTQQTIPVSSSDSGKYTGGFGSSTGQSNLPQQSGSLSSADSGKYTGGFGGATNQEALKPQNSGSDSGKYTGSFGAQPGQPGQSALTQQTIPVSSSDSGKYTGGFGSSTGQSNLPQQSGSLSSADSGKYTGGFGGATNQEALKPQNSGSDSGKYTGSFGAQPGQPASTQQTIPVSSSDSGKYTGGFGSSTGQSNIPTNQAVLDNLASLLLPPKFPNSVPQTQDSTISTQTDLNNSKTGGNAQNVPTSTAFSSKPSKYTGGFGGGPGLLGEQKMKGFAVHPDGNISESSFLASAPVIDPNPVKLASHHVYHDYKMYQPAYSAVKYNGGFGGPPGLLSPYDNTQQSSGTAHKGSSSGTSYNG